MTTKPEHAKRPHVKLVGLGHTVHQSQNADGSTTVSPVLMVRVGLKTNPGGSYDTENTRTMCIVFDLRHEEMFKELLIQHVEAAAHMSRTYLGGLVEIDRLTNPNNDNGMEY